uniref:Putative tail protein n=1 Tax=viral metagenome TaxID=1070528 RepID=A0A6M3K0V5_9ZZZZ
MQAQIYLKGIDELERNIGKLVKDINKGKTSILLKQAQLVRNRIRQKAPIGPTGNLKKAAYAKAMHETIYQPAVAFAGIRPRKAPHAHLVEYGHGGPHPAPPHPFIRLAWDEVKDQVKNNIRLGLEQIIKGAL